MTTQELTIRINRLTEEERLSVSRYIDQILKKRHTSPSLKRYTKEEFYAALDKSRRQAARGEVKPAYQSLAEIRETYGIPA